jgi:uncharacterized membrane protein
MNPLLVVHVAAGIVALAAGAVAVAVRKGGSRHARFGTGFVAAMIVLGVSASILEPLRSPPGSPVGGVMVCYFVATAWMTARRRNGVAARSDRVACAVGFALSALFAAGGVALLLEPPLKPTPPGPFGVLFLAALLLLCALGDLRWIHRGTLTTTQRLRRHLWRMSFAFFIATGSFFLGQQQVLPKALHGSPLLFALAFAPFALMLWWLVRVRWPRSHVLERNPAPPGSMSDPTPRSL